MWQKRFLCATRRGKPLSNSRSCLKHSFFLEDKAQHRRHKEETPDIRLEKDDFRGRKFFSYVHPNVQNEMGEILVNQIKSNKTENVKKSKHFSVFVNETRE